jgi:thymidylate synthase (FAD)
MKATLIEVMGSDLKVVNAARVSFAKQSNWERPFEGNQDLKFLSDGDAKLINYLAKHSHWTPFAHCQLTFHVKAPIFVARQLVKHQVGLVWNEVSRRYVDDAPEFWLPEENGWRLRAANKKQGSSDETTSHAVFKDLVTGERVEEPINSVLGSFQDAATRLYNDLLESGVAPEQARMILPVNLYTEWHWTGSLMAFARVCQLRLDPHAQKEVQYIAQDIDAALRKTTQLQHSWNALMTDHKAEEKQKLEREVQWYKDTLTRYQDKYGDMIDG